MALRFPLQVRRSPEFGATVETWERLAKENRGDDSRRARQRLKEIQRLEALFPRKPFAGRNVPKTLIPKRFGDLGITNLFRNDLPGGWRVLHTAMEVGGEHAVIELAAVAHSEYDRLFGYEGR